MAEADTTPEQTLGAQARVYREWLWLGLILVAGFALRAIYLAEMAQDPRFTVLYDDPEFYDYWARALVSGDFAPPVGRPDPQLTTTPFPVTPGYPYFLAALYWLTGGSFLGARVLQMALGLASCALLYLLGRKVFSARAGLIAAALMATYWAFPYFEGTMTSPVLVTFFFLGLALGLTWWADAPSAARAFAAGLTLGLAILTRSNAMLFGPAIVAWMAVTCWPGRQWRRFLASAAAVTVGTLVLVLPVTVRNYRVSGEFVLTNTGGGMSLLFGNYPEADGVTTFEPHMERLAGPENWNLFMVPTIRRNLGKELGLDRPMGANELERYCRDQALKNIAQDPWTTLRLAARKAYLFWSPREISSNAAIQYEKDMSSILRWLPGFPLVLALFVLGLSFFLRGKIQLPRSARSAAWAVLAILTVYFLSFLPFTVNSRYRAVIIPFLFLFGGYGISRAWGLVAQRQWRGALLSVVVLGASYGLAAWEFVPYTPFGLLHYADRALALKKSGRLDDAIAEIRRALKTEDNRSGHNVLGYLLSVNGQHEEASEHYRRAVELDPSFASAHGNLAYELQLLGRVDEAIAHYETAVQLSPELKIARNNYGNLLLKLGRIDEAVAHFEAVIEQDPRDQFGAYNLGRALMVKGEHEAAVAQFTKAAENDPANPDVHNNMGLAYSELGRAEEALACYRKALDLDPGNAKAHNNLGLEFAKQGKSDEAIENYRKAIDLDPVFTLPRNNLANLLARLGRVDEAVSTLEAALRANPKDEFAHYNLGNILAQQGRIEEALGHYQKAMDNAPLDPNVPNNYGLAMAALGRSQQAIALYRRAIEIAPEYVEAHNNLGYELARIGEYDEAARAYEEALRLNPRYALACNNYGNLLLDQGKTEPALRLFTKAKEANPNDPYADYNLGNLYARQGDWDQAIERFTEAMQHNALDPAVPNNLGLALANVRRYDEAVARFREALERDPQYANAYFNLGNTMATMGRLDDAAQNLRKALELAPNHAQAQENLRRVLQAQGR